MMRETFEKILPESVGIPSKAILGFINQLEKRAVNIRLTALAIGLLESQGMICLNDKICEYFKDKLPTSSVHPWIAETTIKDMLCMATPHQITTYKRYESDDWVASFLQYNPHINLVLFFLMILLLRMFFLHLLNV